MPSKPRETVRYSVREGGDGPVMERFVSVRRTLEGHKHTEIRRYDNGQLRLFYIKSGHPKLPGLPHHRTPESAFEAWQRDERNMVTYHEGDAKKARANSKMKMPKDW